jgi:hypothetical protein
MSFECLDPLLLVTRGEGELPRWTDDIRPKRLTGIGFFFQSWEGGDDVRHFCGQVEMKAAEKEDAKPHMEV